MLDKATDIKTLVNFPNPIFVREGTVLLDGDWTFSFDGKAYRPINVPFCPQSALSGIGYTDFIRECYYKTTFNVLPFKDGERLLLNFGAVDYFCEVYLNNVFIGFHVGGYTPFSFDITPFVKTGKNRLFLKVRDFEGQTIATGKQSPMLKPEGCTYTRTTGIWQPVWIEKSFDTRIDAVYVYPDITLPSVKVKVLTRGTDTLKAEVFFDGEKVGEKSAKVKSYIKNSAVIKIPLSLKRLWKFGEGNLYTIKLTFGKDEVFSYFGLRKAEYKARYFYINNEKFFQNFVLDQGFYPDGIYTAPSVADMAKDIDLSLEMGFNGARLHQKVFDPRYLYYCDVKGYPVWAEFPSWGLFSENNDALGQFISEWQEVIKRDFNHPAIISWCPLNELFLNQQRDGKSFIDSIYKVTKTLDITRPCVDNSGGTHGTKTDLYDFHNYSYAEGLKEALDFIDGENALQKKVIFFDPPLKGKTDLKDIPTNLSEYGGISFGVSEGWGYGKTEENGQDFIKRFKSLVDVILSSKRLSGVCYTQLYDVEQEVNGLYTYGRKDKFTPSEKAEIRRLNLLISNKK